MKITKTRLREIIAEEINKISYDRDDEGGTKSIDSLLTDLGNAAEQLNHDPMASTRPASDALDGLERFRDEKDEEYGELLDQAYNAMNLIYNNPIGSTGLLSSILDKLQKYRLTSWIDDYVDMDNNKAWIDLATEMLSKGRWTEDTFKALNTLKGEIRLGKGYPDLTDEEQELLDLSNPDKNAGPMAMTEQDLLNIIRDALAE